jgi:hypothetical protein
MLRMLEVRVNRRIECVNDLETKSILFSEQNSQQTLQSIDF